MEKRLVVFFIVAFAILMAHGALMRWLYPPQPRPVAQQPAQAEKQPLPEAPPDAEKKTGEPAVEAPAEQPAAELPAEVEAAAAIPEQRVTLGSADENSEYRMLVTLFNRGAAVERIELNSSHHTDQEDFSGYLGHLAAQDAPEEKGALIGVVGAGTPAARAGLAAGDVVTALNQTPIATAESLERAIARTRPNQAINLQYTRNGQSRTAQITLTRRPMEVIRPADVEELIKHWERVGPDVVAPPVDNVPSFLLSLSQVDEHKAADVDSELPGIDLAQGTWEIAPGATESRVEFRRELPRQNLEVIKRYELARVEAGLNSGPAYHLTLTIEIRNRAETDRKIAYQLNGPNGLPTDGWWYASKISRNWGGAGPRDVVVGAYESGRVTPSLISAASIVSHEPEPRRGTPLSYIGVDAQYFSAVMIPQKDSPEAKWFYQWQPTVIGPIPQESDRKRLANVSFILTSETEIVPPQQALRHAYTIFAGPKQPDLVAQYGLGSLIYYGWFGWVSAPMAKLLHAFYYVVRNYGVAIILLTVLVRSAMMPLSRKQVQSAQKMQELQPELKKLQEKYKNDLEARSRAQRELFLKHNYNPLGGCLLMFVQLPIFIGLYRALSMDLELRGAPLLWEGAWCSNLAAPDQLFRWDTFLPSFLVGWLGPYFNLLPVITIALFIWQQKKFMPPATDEQTRMQQKMMQYMMVFIGVMFFKVPSGLCIYFIASSLWGLAERKFMPKSAARSTEPGAPQTSATRIPPKPGGNGIRKEQRGRKQREKR